MLRLLTPVYVLTKLISKPLMPLWNFFKNAFLVPRMDDAIPESRPDASGLWDEGWKFKEQGAWKGDAFMQAANMYEQEGDTHHAHRAYNKAADCWLHTDPLKAIEALRKADLLSDDRDNDTKFAQIYKHYLNDLDKASEHYERVSIYHEKRGEDPWSEKALNKAARCAATGGNFERAVNMFGKILKNRLKTMEYNNLRYFMTTIVLCNLCHDPAVGKQYLLTYANEYPVFGVTEDCNLLKKLVDALEKKDLSAFDSALSAYKSFNVVDWWTNGLLQKLRALITAS